MQIHDFYKSNGLRMIQIPKGRKAPIDHDWPNINRPYVEVEREFDPGGEFNKVGWVLDDEHVVIDIDTHEGGANGYDSLRKLEQELGYLLDEVCGALVRTPSGGAHYYFKKPEDVKFGKVFAKHYPGIDFISGRGKQMIAVGSSHDKHEGRYEFKQASPVLNPIPDDLVQHLQSLGKKDEPKSAPVPAVPSNLVKLRPGDDFNQRGLDHMVSMLRSFGYIVREKADYFQFDRPGKTSDAQCNGHVGMRSEAGVYQLTNFSESDLNFPSNNSMTIFRAYSLLVCEGNDAAATAKLAEEGFGENRDQENVDLNKLIKAVGNQGQVAQNRAMTAFPDALVNDGGLIQAIAEDFEQRSKITTSELNFAVAISLLGAVTLRLVADDSYGQTATNLYTIITAPSGVGKNAPRQYVDEMLGEVRPNVRGPNSITSVPGLLEMMQESGASLILVDEFADELRGWLGANESWNGQIASTLKSIYTSTTTKSFAPRCVRANYRDGRNANDLACSDPHLSVMGVCTKEDFYEAFPRARQVDGFFGRFTVFDLTPPYRRRRISHRAPLDEMLLNRLRYLIESRGDLSTYQDGTLPAAPAIIKRTPDAAARLDTHYEEISLKCEQEGAAGERRISAVWNRTSEKTARFALLFAISKSKKLEDAVIDIECADRAIAISNALTRRLLYVAQAEMDESEEHRTMNRVLKHMTVGEQIGHSWLLRKARMRAYDFKKVIETLVETGEIVAVATDSGAKAYVRVE